MWTKFYSMQDLHNVLQSRKSRYGKFQTSSGPGCLNLPKNKYNQITCSREHSGDNKPAVCAGGGIPSVLPLSMSTTILATILTLVRGMEHNTNSFLVASLFFLLVLQSHKSWPPWAIPSHLARVFFAQVVVHSVNIRLSRARRRGTVVQLDQGWEEVHLFLVEARLNAVTNGIANSTKCACPTQYTNS